MRFMLAFFLTFTSINAEDFITKMEYAKMLYSNPRGIGCNKCHGEKGEGSTIANFVSKGKKKKLQAPAINNISKKKFFKALEDSKSIMPTYFLTKKEIEILYYYVNQKK